MELSRRASKSDSILHLFDIRKSAFCEIQNVGKRLSLTAETMPGGRKPLIANRSVPTDIVLPHVYYQDVDDPLSRRRVALRLPERKSTARWKNTLTRQRGRSRSNECCKVRS